MAGSESERRTTGVDVGPVVVGVGHTEMANVLITVAVGVTDERCFVVVMELGVRDSDEVGSVGDIQETIVVILAVIHVAGKIAVINPDVGGLGLLDGDGVARSIFGLDILDNKIANNDIARMDGKTKAVEDYRRQILASMSPSGKKRRELHIPASCPMMVVLGPTEMLSSVSEMFPETTTIFEFSPSTAAANSS